MPDGRGRFDIFRVIAALGVPACAGTIAGFLGRAWWLLDLFAHFRMQYLGGLLFIAGLLAVGRRWRPAAVMLAFALVNLATVAPLYLAPRGRPLPDDAPTARAMLLNVHTDNRNTAAVLAVIERFDPDLLVLEEIDAGWLERLEPLDERYPHRIVQTRRDNFGIGLFARAPLGDARIVRIGDAFVPSVVARVPVGGSTITVFGTHPPPPGSRRTTAWRDDQLSKLPTFLAGQPGPLLLLGDLNATPWSHPFRRFLRESGLRDSARGHGWQPTWPARNPLFWVPIDHALHSDEIVILDRTVGPAVGSDHRPLVIDFAVRAE